MVEGKYVVMKVSKTRIMEIGSTLKVELLDFNNDKILIM